MTESSLIATARAFVQDGDLATIAESTGLGVPWLRTLRAGTSEDYGAAKIERVLKYRQQLAAVLSKPAASF